MVMMLGVILWLWPAQGGWTQDLKMPEDAPVQIEADELSYDQEKDLYAARGML